MGSGKAGRLTGQGEKFVRSHAKAPFAGSRADAEAKPFLHRRILILSSAALLTLALLLTPALASAAEHPLLENLGSANEPSFSEPRSIAIDQSTDDVLVADAGTGTISGWGPDGEPAEFSALGSNEIDGSETPEGELVFGGPGETQIAVDNSGGATDGDIYVPQANAGPEEKGLVDIFSPTGEFLGQLTESSEGELAEPCGVTVDPSGNVYVADFSEHIHKYADPPVDGESTDLEFGGACELAAGAGPSEGFIFAAKFFQPFSKLDATTGEEEYVVDPDLTITVGVDPTTGNVYSSTEAGGEPVIAEFNASGPSSSIEESSTPLAGFASGIAVNESTGDVYVVREGSPNVEVLRSNYGHHFLENLGSANEPSFSEPRSIAIDQSTDDVLVADAGTGTISGWGPDGEPAEFSALGSNEIDGSETPEGELVFGGPGETQIAVDNSGGATDGDIYVPQANAGPEEKGLVDIFSPTGEFLGQLTESSEGELAEPCGVTVDPSGNVYVADFSEHIHKYADPPVDGESTDLEFGGACELAAGAGPSEGFIFAAKFFQPFSKLDATTGEEEYVVDPDLTITVGVDPTTGNVYSSTEAGGEPVIAEFNASGPLGAAELPPPTSLAGFAAGIAVNGSTGNVYVVREGSPNVEVFAPGLLVEFELAIQKTGSGSGTVTSLPPNTGIDCGTECSAKFEGGTEVELKATPEPESEFAGWSTVAGDPGTCTGTTSPCTVTMGEAVELEAEFVRIPPAVTALSPIKGPTAGGSQVEITGTNLTEATKVSFGANEVNCPSADCALESATEIKVKAPAHAAGAVDVLITGPGGTSANTAADDYTFVDVPTVSALSPTVGSTAGGNEVEVTGTDLAEASKVEFGTTVAKPPFLENTDTTIKLKAPGHSAGTVNVRVSAIGGVSADTAADDYTYVAPPVVTALSPAKGPTEGGNQVEITGMRLAGATKVSFGANEVTCPSADCALESPTEIEVKAPAHAAGTVNVLVTSIGGASGNFAADDYTYEVPAPAPEPPVNPPTAPTVPLTPNPPPQCVVPKLKGLSLAKAKSALTNAHCKTGEVSKPKAKKGKKQPALVVKSSRPGAGASLAADSKVDLKLGSSSKGKKA
jgi:hypothetical protein